MTTNDKLNTAIGNSRVSDATGSKTLTLRLPLDAHKKIEEAANRNGQSLNTFISNAAIEAAEIAQGKRAPMQSPVAIFIDLDPFNGRPTIDVDSIEHAAATLGRPIVRRSFSTIGSVDISTSIQALLGRNYRHELLSSRDELRLGFTSAARDINTNNTAREFIFVSEDEFFGSAAARLIDTGAKVTCFGVRSPSETKQQFIRPFTDFRYYEQVSSPPKSTELGKLQERYMLILIQSVHALENRDAKAVLAALKPEITARNPEFSLGMLDLETWTEFAQLAAHRGWVNIEPSGKDFRLQLTPSGREKAQALHANANEVESKIEEVALVSKTINEILGINLPDASTRFLIFNSVQWVLNEELTEDGMALIDLSYRVASHLGRSEIPQNTIYRLLNGLYRCGAFEYIPNTENKNNPRILRAKISVFYFDDAFLLNLMHMRKKFPILNEGSARSISTLVYGSPSHHVKIASMLENANDPHSERANISAWIAKQ